MAKLSTKKALTRRTLHAAVNTEVPMRAICEIGLPQFAIEAIAIIPRSPRLQRGSTAERAIRVARSIRPKRLTNATLQAHYSIKARECQADFKDQSEITECTKNERADYTLLCLPNEASPAAI